MSDPAYVVDPRRLEDVRRELRLVAERTPLPGADVSWGERLFQDDEFAAPGEPSQALLAALVALHPRLAEHASTLPERTRLDWLERTLGIGRLPVEPDRVAVAATVEPAAAPLVIPSGTLLRGGKDAFGAERRYATTDALTAHGAGVLDVRAYEATGATPQEDWARWDDRSVPFAPFPGDVPPPHTCRFASPVLDFTGGEMQVRLTFEGGDARRLAGASWRSSSGSVAVEAVAAQAVTLWLTTECRPDPAEPGGLPWIEVSLAGPDVRDAQALGFGFSRVWIEVAKRKVPPDSAYYNDGLLDVTREFQPFGPVPRRGDAFYLRSDEAFAKPLSSFTVGLTVSQGSSQLDEAPVKELGTFWLGAYELKAGTKTGAVSGTELIEEYHKYPYEQIPKILGKTFRGLQWQRRTPLGWSDVGASEKALKTVSLPGSPTADGAVSDEYELGGAVGRFVRAFLAGGDFGWTAYQRRVATFAAAAAGAGTGKPNANDLLPPEAPVVSTITIDYTTARVPVSRVTGTSGWAVRRRPDTGVFQPFELPVPWTAPDTAAMVGVGLTLPEASLGSSVSLYVEIESASACTGAAVAQPVWEHWGGDGWRALDVVDGTRGLRQSGLLRFVAPAGWPVGCDGAGAREGRWIRLLTASPGSIGTIRALIPDAVEAEYVSRAPDPSADPTPGAPLPPGGIKGLTTPIPGVKRLTSMAGVRGRGPETEAAYARRAAGIVRHRRRVVQPWDYEEVTAVEFPEVAAARCLPHTRPDGASAPGWVGLVVLPFSPEPMPAPTVTLTERIRDRLTPMMPLHAQLAVLCPSYVAVTVDAVIELAPGIAALTGKEAIGAALERRLHPTGTLPPRFGRSLYASEVVAFLESLGEVDHVEDFALRVDGSEVTHVEVHPCRGLVASSGSHRLIVRERL